MTPSASGVPSSSRKLTEWEQAQEESGARMHRGLRALGRGTLVGCAWYLGWRVVLRVVPAPYGDAAVLAMDAGFFWWVMVSFYVGMTLSFIWDELAHAAARTWLRSRKGRWLLGVACLVTTLPGLLLRDWYVSFERDTMAVSDFWTLGREYRRSYDDVRAVRIWASPKKGVAWGLDVRFAWGLPWESEYGAGQNASLETLKKAGSFVATRAGVRFHDRSDAFIRSLEESRRTGVW